MPTRHPVQPVVWRSGSHLAQAVRAARSRLGLTQRELSQRAGVGLKFLYELETGKETLRADKVFDVLDVLALRLVMTGARAAAPGVREERASYAVQRAPAAAPDYIGMACTTAGVSLRSGLRPDELIRSLLGGEVPRGKQAHFIVLLEEAPAELLRGLVAQVGAWAKPGAVARNLQRIARHLGVRFRLPG